MSGIYSLTCNTRKEAFVGQTSRNLKLRYQEHARYIKNYDTQSVYSQHILHNRHEYGPIDNPMTFLKPLSNTSLLTPYEQYYIYSLHKEGKLILSGWPDLPCSLQSVRQRHALTLAPRRVSPLSGRQGFHSLVPQTDAACQLSGITPQRPSTVVE